MYPYSGAATSVPLLYDTRRAREEVGRDGEKMRRARRQMKDDRGQPFGTAQGLVASGIQRSDIKGLRSGIKLISDLRLLISGIDDFYEFPQSAIPARHREPARSGEAGGRDPKSKI